jgi:hypothetical protein
MGEGGHVMWSVCASHVVWIVLRNHLPDTMDSGCPGTHKNFPELQHDAYNRSCKILTSAHFSSVQCRADK